jgi:type III pantothenate kinase
MIEIRTPIIRDINKADKTMNIIAIDIGNTNIKVAFYLDDEEKFIRSLDGDAPDIREELAKILRESWEQVPLVRSAMEHIHEGVIVASSVKPAWTEMVEQTAQAAIRERILLIGRDIPLPMETGVENPQQVGTDRVVASAAAYAVVEDAVAIASFGTAVTIDLVDEDGVFRGGVIAPGFAMGAKALHEGTAQLPLVKIGPPQGGYGANTEQAINAGLFYSAAGLLRTVVEKYAEEIGKWPHVIVTGAAAGILKDECEFVDSWVPNLAVRGIVIAYKKYVFEKAHINELDAQDNDGG